MTIFHTGAFKNSLAVTAVTLMLAPTAQAEIGLGVGVSVGGHGDHGGADVGVGASVGGSDGIGAGVGASVGGGDGVNAGVGASVGGGDGLGAGAGVSVGGGSGTDDPDNTPTATAGRAITGGDNSATTPRPINIATLIGAPVWSKDSVLVGMIEEVAPGPNGKVDAVLRLNAALDTDRDIIRMRIAPRLSERGALKLGYSKQKFLQLFAG
ncbi:hypothetical protein [Sulfitobacter sp. 1A13679]|uniref:hypothetical protein n=1 Tax=Sulfitobacter sp. 1A13679 TaxID=3368597 RepID=UPI00374616FC